MFKNRYIVLITAVVLVATAIVLSLSVSSLADTWKGEKLTAKEAENIALADAGYTREEVTFKPTEFDTEKGRAVWEVEFYHENTEYDFEIAASTGEILKKDQEIENKPTKPTPKPEPTPTPTPNPEPNPTPNPEPNPTPTPNPEPTVSAELSEEKALEIALADAGLTVEVISRLKIEKDRDDGVLVYEIEFYHGYTEYDYEIRVSDGKILERDIDLD